MNILHPLAFALIAGLAGAAQAQAPKSEPPPAKASAPGMLTDAVVQKIDPARGLIVLKHGDIPNLAMPPMTMGFDVAEKQMLEQVKPGDKVRFHVEVVKGKPTVTHLEAAR
ncbi:copper-binding protein [Variovorax boronicumulans]|uniref:copper-binding protein n=1 Tax=Variovorax boronicumulans TaxID=436515 RepID=UPI0036F42E7A